MADPGTEPSDYGRTYRSGESYGSTQRMTDPGNIATICGHIYKYIEKFDDRFIAVAHRVVQKFSDSEIGQAVAYIRALLDPDEHTTEAAARSATTSERRLPHDAIVTAGTCRVRVMSRAYQHIPPDYWRDFADWIVRSSIGDRIKEAGSSVARWYQVTLTSDEKLGDARIVIVATYERDELMIYHSHPDIHNYRTYASN